MRREYTSTILLVIFFFGGDESVKNDFKKIKVKITKNDWRFLKFLGLNFILFYFWVFFFWGCLSYVEQ
jgi:hypothetical protein